MAGVAILIISLIGIVVGALIAPDEANATFRDAGAVIAFAGLAAVAIERVIEGLYTVLSGPLGQWWPLSTVKEEFDTYEKETNALLNTGLAEVTRILTAARETAVAGSDQAKKIQTAIDSVEATKLDLLQEFEDARGKLAPGSARLERVSAIAERASQRTTELVDGLGDVAQQAERVLADARKVADRSLLIVGSFGDNPARRLASIGIGAALGSLVAGGVGLNIFAATLVESGQGAAAPIVTLLLGGVGVALSGIVIGLGSAPTHEVIKSLQEYKKSRRGSATAMTHNETVDNGASASGFFGTDARTGAVTAVPNRVIAIRRTD